MRVVERSSHDIPLDPCTIYLINSFTGILLIVLLIVDSVTDAQTIHPRENLISLNLLKTWTSSFLTSEVVEAVRGQKHHISAHTLAL